MHTEQPDAESDLYNHYAFVIADIISTTEIYL